jgi:hypothetical protein
MEACLQMVNVSQAAETLSSGSIQSTPFFVFLENFNCCHMKHEVETDRHSNPQDTLDAEKVPSSDGTTETDETNRAELEERVRRDCRRECRRNLFVELLKTVAKVAGVILAAMGLSSFNEED